MCVTNSCLDALIDTGGVYTTAGALHRHYSLRTITATMILSDHLSVSDNLQYQQYQGHTYVGRRRHGDAHAQNGLVRSGLRKTLRKKTVQRLCSAVNIRNGAHNVCCEII